MQTKSLRPKGLPAFLGNDFFLIGYRVFVRYKNNAGRSMRGLYILKSETGKLKMELPGNIFTHYKYARTDISSTLKDDLITVESEKSAFKIAVEKMPTTPIAAVQISFPKSSKVYLELSTFFDLV